MEGDPLNFRPPVLVGERVAWLGSGSGLPQGAVVRWIGRVPEITNGWTVGIELDRAMPVGGIDGTWRKRKLFACETKHGLLVPIDKIVKESSLLKTRHSLGESFYSEGGKPISEGNKALLRQLSLPQSQTPQEFISKVLPSVDRRQKTYQDDVTALNFKVAAVQARSTAENGTNRNVHRDEKLLEHSTLSLGRGTVQSETKLSASRQRGILRTFSLEKPKVAPLSVENVGCATVPSEKQDWAATCEEWERFKKYLDAVGNFSQTGNANNSQGRRRRVGKNPSSLYALAKPDESLFETSLALRLIGERKEQGGFRSVRRQEVAIKEESCENSIASECDKSNVVQGENPPSTKKLVNREESKLPLEQKNFFGVNGNDQAGAEKLKINNISISEPQSVNFGKVLTVQTDAEKNDPLIWQTNSTIDSSCLSAKKDVSDGQLAQRNNELSGEGINRVYDVQNTPFALSHLTGLENRDCSIYERGPGEPIERECTEEKDSSFKVTTNDVVLNRDAKSRSHGNGKDLILNKSEVDGTDAPEIERSSLKTNANAENVKDLPNRSEKKREKTDSAVQTRPARTKKPTAQLKALPLKESKSSELPELQGALEFTTVNADAFQAFESLEENYCGGFAAANGVEVLIAEEIAESVPAPTLRRKRQPVPTPRRKQKEERRGDDENFDTASVLYEPAFLRAYCDEEPQQNTMTDIQGTFRRIDEDDIDRPIFQNHHRLLSASVSAPETNKKGLFSFLRWFKRNKHVEDLDLNALNSSSIASSPVFPRTDRLASAESVDTLYSIATASSFAFVPASQYQREHNVVPEPRKKRRAPQPPLRRDTSLPNTLEFRGRVSHRRTASESYKDRRFAHVQGKRKAPPPPVPPPRLYPTLSSVKDPYPSLLKKKRPAPLPPEPEKEIPAQEESSTSEQEQKQTASSSVAEANNNVSGPSSLVMGIPGSEENVVCNDTLKLERGVLKPTKTPSATPDVAKVIPLSPVSPRPWYKRKSLEKRKEKVSEDWMPEVGFARPGISPDVSPLKLFFTRGGGGDDKKKEEKRKSGISMLANISELDREAAEICKREQEQQQQKLAASDAKFYNDPVDVVPSADILEDDGPKKNSTRELISLFNNIGSVKKVSLNSSFFARHNGAVLPKKIDYSEKDLAIGVVSTPEIKMAAVVGTKDFVAEEAKPSSSKLEVVEDVEPESGSKAQAMFDSRGQRHHSPSPTISTIAEMSEPSSSAATTMNQYAEPVWKCARCTLENAHWRNRCDACSACKPNYNPVKSPLASTPFDRRKSEMDLEIDWEQELQKYFPTRTPPKEGQEISGKLTLSKSGDVEIKTEMSNIDIDEVRKRRMAFFMKSLGNDVTSLRDAAAKKSLDESEKLKLKGMLKEMKESLPKREVINNASSNLNGDVRFQPDVTSQRNDSSMVNGANDDGKKYGAIRKLKKEDPTSAEALLITTTTVFEDVIVKKKVMEKEQQTSPVVEIPVHNFTTVGIKNGKPYTELKKARRIGDGPFELLRARDLASIIQTKTGTQFPAHVYANVPAVRQSEASESSGDVDDDRLTTAAGLAKFKASLDPSATDTIAVNRLLRKLEGAIADGRHDQAAALARDLAVLKVSCSVIRQRPSPSPSPTAITVEMFVEDKVSHQGPIPLQLQRSMTLTLLKTKIQTDFQIPNHVQRWILGKRLATDESKTLEELGVTEDRCPIFLYLVAPEVEAELNECKPSVPPAEDRQDNGSEGASGETSSEKDKDGPPRGKGWYYNYEEDRYSFCESESDQSPEKEIPAPAKVAAKRVIQRTIDAVRGPSKSVTPPTERHNFRKEEPMVVQPSVQSKPYQPRTQRPPLLTSQSLPEHDFHCEQNTQAKEPSKEPANASSSAPKEAPSGLNAKNGDLAENVAAPQPTSEGPDSARPRSRSIFDLMKPQSNDTLKKDLKMISVNVKETIEMLSRRGEDITRQGWRCATCTLVNPATRPGCAACTSPRPPGYAPPPPRPAEQELRRLRRDQALEIPFKEPETPINGSQTYLQLVNLDNAGVVANTDEFECPVCMMLQAVGEGVVLRECLHNFCRACLEQTIQYNEEAEVKCPFRDDSYACESVLQEREIKALVPREVWEQHLARSVAQAENKIGNTFHCKTPDCRGWCIVEDNVNEYRCPVCRHANCLTCQTIHEGLDCRQYQERLKNNSETDAEAKRTRSMLEEMVQRGDAMACPTCQVVLMKKWGCDWLRCSMCKTEICWVTRGHRWGPAGKGDTSAGCQCGINGIKCHPKCNYCH